MIDPFYAQETCDRCNGSLADGRTMSMFNTDCICLKCKKKERNHPDYEKARNADIAAVKSGNYNFKGIGYPGQ